MRILMSLLVATFFLGGQAVAGDDPRENESGAVYELYIEYCVAMDCDDPELQMASAKACEKIKAKYYRLYEEQITCGPAVQVECPCWSENDIIIFNKLWIRTNNDDCHIPYEDDGYVYIMPAYQKMEIWVGYASSDINRIDCDYLFPDHGNYHYNLTDEEHNVCIQNVKNVIPTCPGL